MAFSAPQRSALARAMADRVVGAAHPLPVAVVCDDTEVAGWARDRGALVVWEPGRGLNGAVEAGIEHLVANGVTQVTVAHADLPRASDLALVGDDPGITLVPDRYGNGTNVIVVPGDAGFRFSYGPGSFARHRNEAERLGFPSGSSIDPTWPGTSTNPAMSCPWPHSVSRPRDGTLRSRCRTSGVERAPGGRPARPPGRSPSISPCRPARWPSAPIPTTSNSGAERRWPSGRQAGAGSTTSCSPTVPRAAGTPTPTWWPWWSARRRECRAAADVIDGGTGAASRSPTTGSSSLGQVDGELVNGVDERREVARIIRTVRPTVVLGHDPWRRYRLHPDHRAAGFLTVDALVAARDPHFFPELGLAPHRPDVLLLFEADLPNHVEDARGFEGTEDRRPALPSRASGSRPWASNRPVDRVRVRRARADSARTPVTTWNSPPRCDGSWPSTGRWPGSAQPRPSAAIPDL